MVKNPPANAGDARDMGSVPGSGRSPGEGNGKALQDPCVEYPMDRGAWPATVHGAAKRCDRAHTHIHTLQQKVLLEPCLRCA